MQQTINLATSISEKYQITVNGIGVENASKKVQKIVQVSLGE